MFKVLFLPNQKKPKKKPERKERQAEGSLHVVSKMECASAFHYKRSLRVTALRGDQQRAQQSGSAYINVNPHVLWQSVLYTCLLVRKIIQLSVKR